MQSFSDPQGPIEFTLRQRLRCLQTLVRHLPEVKEVHIEVVEHDTHNLKSIADQLVACPVLTSFSIKSPGFLDTIQDPVSGIVCPGALEWVPWSHLQESVDLAIWSREHGFLVDNTEAKKAEQEAEAARERRNGRVRAKYHNAKVASGVPDILDFSGGTDEGSLDDFAGQETS
ncbi:hypothetical protein Q7P35_003484 [Cladosporium inversicolor]